MCYSEQYIDGTAQQLDSFIVGWVDCVTVNIMWKVLQSNWTVILWVEWSVSQWTVCVIYCIAYGRWYCWFNGVWYIEQYVVGTAQQLDSGIVCWKVCVTVNIMWNVRHSWWTVLLCDECSVLQWTIYVNFCTAGVDWSYSLNVVCYSELYVVGTAQQV